VLHRARLSGSLRAWLARCASPATLTGGHTGVVSHASSHPYDRWVLSRLACTTQFPHRYSSTSSRNPFPPPPSHKSARRGWARRRNPLRSLVPPAADQATSHTVVGSGHRRRLLAQSRMDAPLVALSRAWLDPIVARPHWHRSTWHSSLRILWPFGRSLSTCHSCCNLLRVSRHSRAHLYSPAGSAARYWQAPLAELSPRLSTGSEAAH